MCALVAENIAFKSYFSGINGRLSKNLEIAIYRISQELISSVVENSAATKASIKLSIRKKRIKITVENNGNGFNMLNMTDGNISIQSIHNKLQPSCCSLDLRLTVRSRRKISVFLKIIAEMCSISKSQPISNFFYC
jgi:two-component system sensor histidine kinase DegS